jgi:alginate O-acetyltransferase complex protein AlgI
MNQSSIFGAWLGIIAFAFQIYFDFSGYSDMAIGLGKCFGFNFLENFNHPYISKSITEFWRRWHISLGSWFREYVYIPLGGNRKGFVRQIINISIVWLLTGIWHGAYWNYIIWGCYFGIILIIEKLFLLKHLKKAPSIISHIYSLFLILIGWTIFSMEDLNVMLTYLQSMFINTSIIDSFSLFECLNNLFLLVVCGITSIGITKKIYQKHSENILFKNIVLIGLLIISICYLASSSYNPFLYFRF